MLAENGFMSRKGLFIALIKWWPGTELNRRRQPFQGCALPPELPGHFRNPLMHRGQRGLFESRKRLREQASTSNACGTLLIITKSPHTQARGTLRDH